MKRFHIHIGVENLEQSIKFYNALFGAEPAKTKGDYAKWMLDDPRVNFAISTRVSKPGVDHLGVQVEDDNELEELRTRMKNANMSLFDEGQVVCCYARSEKTWVEDPAGIAWEAYKTMQDSQRYASIEADSIKNRSARLVQKNNNGRKTFVQTASCCD